MPIVAQPTNNNALVIDDRISRGVGPSAKKLLESLGHSAREYYALSEALLSYPPAFAHDTLLICGYKSL